MSLHPFSFLGRHPLLIGGVLVGAFVLYVLTRSKASATSTGVTVAPAAENPTIQAAEINAAGAISIAQQTAATQANNNATAVALAAQKSAADYATAQLNAQTSTVQQVNAITGSTNLAQIQAGTQNLAISTQGQMMSEQTQAALDATLSNNSLALNADQINGAVSMANTRTNADAAVSVAQSANDAQVQIAQANSTAAVQLGQQQADTQQTIAGYGAGIAALQLQDSTAIASQQLSNQASSTLGILSLIKSGTLNKGASGGANQVAAIAAVTGQPSIAAPAYATATAQNAGSSVTGVISSLGGAISNVAGTVAKGFFGTPATTTKPKGTATSSITYGQAA